MVILRAIIFPSLLRLMLLFAPVVARAVPPRSLLVLPLTDRPAFVMKLWLWLLLLMLLPIDPLPCCCGRECYSFSAPQHCPSCS